MTLFEIVSEEIKRLFDWQGEHGIVVWYDQGGTLSGLVKKVVPQNTNLLCFEGSYLAIRFELEDQSPDLKGRWLIYIPEKPPSPQESWLRDFELLGERLEMDLLGLLQRRFNLAITPTLSDLIRRRTNNAKDLTGMWQSLIGNKEINEVNLVNALLALAFRLSSWNFSEAILHFCCRVNWQAQLNERGLWEIWRQRLREWFGWPDAETPNDEDGLRQKVCASLLLSELVKFEPSLTQRFPFLPEEPKREMACELVKRWRDSTSLHGVYKDVATQVEHRYGLDRLLTVSESLLEAETFGVVEELWIHEVRDAIRPDGSNFGEKVEQLNRIAEKRKGSFWSRKESAFGDFWEAISTATALWKGCNEAIEVARRLQDVTEFIDHYSRTDGWWQLDFKALQLAARKTSLSDDDRQKFVVPSYLAYCKFLTVVNELFADSVERQGWKSTTVDIWQEVLISRKRKTAVFIVDALRFDLAMYLKDLLADILSFEISSLKSSLPSITELGMAALLPKANEGLGISFEDGRPCVTIGSEEVGTRAGRIRWLREFLGRAGKLVNLDEITKEDTQRASLIVVFCREIDEFGTFAAELHPKGLLEMVERIAQAIRSLLEKGFTRVFVFTDHGFLFVPPECRPNKIQASPVSLMTKRRFSVGVQGEGSWNVKATELGFSGDLIFAFPKGFSVFSLPGEMESFLHGGLSLQESVIPVLDGRARTKMEKVGVKLVIQEPITSRIVRITLEAHGEMLLVQKRRVKVRIGTKESSEIEVSMERQKVEESFRWLDEFEDPPEVAEVQLLDAETGEVLETKHIQVKLLV